VFTSTATEAEDYYNLPLPCYTHVTTISCTNSMSRETYKRSLELFWSLSTRSTFGRFLPLSQTFKTPGQ